jgi:hypothetical protein
MALLGFLVAIAAVLLGSGPLSANDLVEQQNQHSPTVGQRLKGSFFPGFRRKPDAPHISFFNAKERQRYPFADELEKADANPPPGTFDNLDSPHPPVGNVFRFNF